MDDGHDIDQGRAGAGVQNDDLSHGACVESAIDATPLKTTFTAGRKKAVEWTRDGYQENGRKRGDPWITRRIFALNSTA